MMSKKGVIGNKGSAKRINTKFGYYSSVTEDYLNKEIETPFSKIINYLDEVDLENKSLVTLEMNIKEDVLNFVYALVARAPSFHQMMDIEKDEMFINFSIEEKRDFIIKTSIHIAKEQGFINEHILTFMINKTNIPFVLSMNGIYNYTFNNSEVINLPITPYIAICFLHKDLSNRIYHKDGAISMFEIIKEEHVMHMNEQAFKFQLRQNWGYVVCPNKDELKRLATEIKQ